MNNNRNNRRRGRGNRNQSGGGGNQANRIDSRARGNAPQLLEKYKKLAQDAQHNGDRVQAEYYLQFADHYFRVIADNKARQEEPRGRRPDERDIDEDEGEDDDFDSRRRDSHQSRRQRERRDDRDTDQRDTEPRDDEAAEGEPAFEIAENPFVVRDEDERRERRERRPARRPRRDAAAADNASAPSGAIDSAALPPAIGAREERGEDAVEDRPAPRRRRRKLNDDGPISAVG